MPRRKRQKRTSPKHAWKESDRLDIILLDLCFKAHPKNIAKIFNVLHQQSLQEEGFGHSGMSDNSFSAQLHEYRNGRTGSSLYKAVSMMAMATIQDVFKHQIDIIKMAASKLKINLDPRHSPDRHTFSRPIPFHSKRNDTCNTQTQSVWMNTSQDSQHVDASDILDSDYESDTTVTTWVADPNDSDVDFFQDDQEIDTPTRRRRIEKYVNVAIESGPEINKYLSSMISPGTPGIMASRRPRFLYRAFDVSHGFNARLFLDTDVLSTPIPPRFRSRAFDKMVRPHLERDTSYSSPFLSLTQFPGAAVKHVFDKLIASSAEMALAIFRYDDVRKDCINRFGIESGPYLVPVVCKEYKYDDLPGGYTGRGEFLVWGSINCEPVAVMSFLDTLMMRAKLNATWQIDYSNGKRFSENLPRIDSRQLELFLYQLVMNWSPRIKNRKRLVRKSEAWDEFVRGATGNCKIAQANETPTDNEDNIIIEISSDSDNDDEWNDDFDDDLSDMEYEIVSSQRRTRQTLDPTAWRSDCE